jgi:hypothetical protein
MAVAASFVQKEHMNHIEAIEPRRHFSAVSLDASFGTAGVVSLRNGIPAKYATADTVPTSVVVDHAGRAIVVSVSYDRLPGNGGYRTPTTVMTRLLPDGRPDPRFAVATGGSVEVFGEQPDVAVDSQNRIYVLGYGDLTRYTASGKIDRTFGTGGFADFRKLTGDLDVYATHITVGGGDVLWAFLSYSTEVSTAAQIVRLTTDGQDIGSASGVNYATVTPGDVQYQYDGVSPGLLETLQDGSVIAVAHFSVGIYPPGATVNDEVIERGVTVHRFQPSGKPDRAYGKRGRVVYRKIATISDTDPADFTPVSIAGDGTVLLKDQPQSGKARNVLITPAGRAGGLATVGPRVTTGQILTQPDGQRLVLDTVAKTLRRYKADGTIDSTFNDGLPVDGVSTMAFGPAGTLLTADTGRNSTDTRYVVRRIDL